ncbi:MAG: hypothetical protein ACFFAU_17075 [Candidatus Hodarchaeota archaeon]
MKCQFGLLVSVVVVNSVFIPEVDSLKISPSSGMVNKSRLIKQELPKIRG